MYIKVTTTIYVASSFSAPSSSALMNNQIFCSVKQKPHQADETAGQKRKCGKTNLLARGGHISWGGGGGRHNIRWFGAAEAHTIYIQLSPRNRVEC